MTIYKYPVMMPDRGNTFTIDLPEGAEVLSVGVQRGEGQIWAMVDPRRAPKPRTFFLHSTGHGFAPEAGMHFIGTFQLMDGVLVFHLFDVP